MARKAKPLSTQEILASFTGALRRTATRPTVVGYKPMDHQIKFHQSTARQRAVIGGNRSGKTVGGATETIWWLKGEHPYRPVPQPPVHGRAVAVDFDHGVEKIVKPEVARWIPPSLLQNGSWDDSYSRQLRTLTCENGSTLEFMSYDQELQKFAGTSRHFTWFDEQPPQDIFNECLLRLVDVGGSWWMTMTPLEGMDWVYDDIYLKSQTDSKIYVVGASMDMNVHINTTEIDEYLSKMSGEERSARREGKFVSMGGLIYGKSFDPHRNIIEPILNSETWHTYLGKWSCFLSLDHGFNNPTAVLWIFADTEGRMVVFDEYYVSREIVGYHAREIQERNRALGIEPAYIVGDPTIRNTDPITGTSVLLEYQEHGVSIALGNNDVRAGINRVARKFEDGTLFITRNCERTLWELGKYRWSKWANSKTDAQRNVKEEPVKKDDHLMDSLRYAVASRYAAGEDIEQKPQNWLGAPEGLVVGAPLINSYNPPIKDPFDTILGSDW